MPIIKVSMPLFPLRRLRMYSVQSIESVKLAQARTLDARKQWTRKTAPKSTNAMMAGPFRVSIECGASSCEVCSFRWARFGQEGGKRTYRRANRASESDESKKGGGNE